jgi:hypothetical protein
VVTCAKGISLKNYQDITVENCEDIKGVSIADVRIAKASDGLIQRVALMFEDGAVFEGLSCRAFDPGPVVDTRYEQKVLIEILISGQTLKTDWVAVGYTDYYEDFFPRFEFRAAPSWSAGPDKRPRP